LLNESKKLTGPFLIDLKNKFREIAGKDQLIDIDEFRNGLELSNKQICDRLFTIFDKDGNGTIDYSEFMDTIKSMIVGSNKDKIRFAFQLHDLDNSGSIDRNELKILIKQSFAENRLEYDDFQLDLLVDEFFDRADKDKSGTIDYNEFLEIANDYPDFMEGFAVNPLHWLIPDRYEQVEEDNKTSYKGYFKNKIQVQDIGIFHWLLIPRLIFLYNVLVNRKKNRSTVGLQSVKLLPSKVLELTISSPDEFDFEPGDYLYLNCKEISTVEWYPFNIIRRSVEGDLVLHVKSNNYWAEKLYDSTLDIIGKDTSLNWNIRIDGPYGSSSKNIVDTEHAIIIVAGHGISRIAPILQDIVMRMKDGDSNVSLKRIDLYWLIENQSYYEWFTKLLKDMEVDSLSKFFNYHIFFLDKSPEQISEKMMYISTNVSNKKSKLSLVNNLSDKTRFGIPKWEREFAQISSFVECKDRKVFYSGPIQLSGNIKKQSKKAGIPFKKGSF
tara:strand:- start:796 stop:2283 length:1488 start_codon:yes stop_codon:yes gene_type:complete